MCEREREREGDGRESERDTERECYSNPHELKSIDTGVCVSIRVGVCACFGVCSGLCVFILALSVFHFDCNLNRKTNLRPKNLEMT